MGARNKMYFNSWLFSLVRGEHRIILSSRHCGQWAFGEFGVRRLCTFWGGETRRTFTKQTQCHLAAGVGESGGGLAAFHAGAEQIKSQ